MHGLAAIWLADQLFDNRKFYVLEVSILIFF